MLQVLRKLFPFKELGWTDIGEEFTRFTLFSSPWFKVYLHRLKALVEPPECHDHPWSFITFILKGGYNEYHDGKWIWRGPGSILYRPAEFSHNVVTKGVAWSIVIVGNKKRNWGFQTCAP